MSHFLNSESKSQNTKSCFLKLVSISVNGSLNGLRAHLGVIYIDMVLLDALHSWVQLLHWLHLIHPLTSQPITATQTKIETHTSVSQCNHTHSTNTRGQRMNNAEVPSEWKSPPLFPSFSPSLSNKEAMLPWRQWSLGALTTNYIPSCVKQPTNGQPRLVLLLPQTLRSYWLSAALWLNFRSCFWGEKTYQGVPPVCCQVRICWIFIHILKLLQAVEKNVYQQKKSKSKGVLCSGGE